MPCARPVDESADPLMVQARLRDDLTVLVARLSVLKETACALQERKRHVGREDLPRGSTNA